MEILNEDGPVRFLRTVRVGRGVVIWPFVNAYECEIGNESSVGTFVEIQKGVRVGRKCKISSHSFLCEGVTLEDEVFVGHHVVFTNDKYPRATNPDGSMVSHTDWQCTPTTVKKGACIGSNASILCGITIGEGAIVGLGAVVTKNVPPGVTVVGNPARII